MSAHAVVMGYQESARKINNAHGNSFHHKTCMLGAYVGFLHVYCTNLPPTHAASVLCQPQQS